MKKKYLILATLSVVAILMDQLTKELILRNFHLGQTLPIIPGLFSFTYIRNTGAAFGILSTADPSFRVPFFVIFPIVALSVIAAIFQRLGDQDRKLSAALALVIGGALGNLIDRVRFGYVVDFIDFHWNYLYHFPAFNIADSAICIGVAILMFDMAAHPEPATPPAPSKVVGGE